MRHRGNNIRSRSNVRVEPTGVDPSPSASELTTAPEIVTAPAVATAPVAVTAPVVQTTPAVVVSPTIVIGPTTGMGPETPGPFVVSLTPRPEESPFSERPTLPDPEPVESEHPSFFDGGGTTDAPPDDPALDATPDPKLVLKMRPDVRARRAKLTRYVQWTVGALVVMCVVALGKMVAARGPQRVAAHAVPPAAVAVTDRYAGAAPVAAEAPAAAAPSQTEPSPVVAEPVAPAPPATDAKAAADEKKDARIALERGAFAKAIAAGERSVALDAKDGEAWLILGAAYQSLGKALDARRSFVACTKEGTRGPIGECRAMLR
jgi:hypothetical protein